MLLVNPFHSVPFHSIPYHLIRDEQLLRELDALGWAHVESLETRPAPTITLRHTDAKKRVHALRLALAPEHPQAAPLAVAARLPGGAAFEVGVGLCEM